MSLFGPGYWYWLANLQEIWYFFQKFPCTPVLAKREKWAQSAGKKSAYLNVPFGLVGLTAQDWIITYRKGYLWIGVNHYFFIYLFFCLWFFFFCEALHFPDPCLFKHTIVALTQNVSEKWTFLNSLVGCERKKIVLIYASVFIAGVLKTGLAKISTHSTSWQFKNTKTLSKADKKPLTDAGQ